MQLDGRGRRRARRLALAPVTSILARTPLLIRPATVAFPSVAVLRWAGVTLATVLSGSTVAAGAPVGNTDDPAVAKVRELMRKARYPVG